jgi:hypothetical protein
VGRDPFAARRMSPLLKVSSALYPGCPSPRIAIVETQAFESGSTEARAETAIACYRRLPAVSFWSQERARGIAGARREVSASLASGFGLVADDNVVEAAEGVTRLPLWIERASSSWSDKRRVSAVGISPARLCRV